MKTIINILLATVLGLASYEGTAQLRQSTVNVNNNNLAALATFGPDGANIGSSSTYFNPPKQISGSYHLFDTFNNKGIFFTEGDRQLFIRNINYNLITGLFESEIDDQTVFTFNFDNIDKLVVNGQEFISVIQPATGKSFVYEVIYEGEDFSLLKQHFLQVKTGSDNPMAMRPDKYVRKSDYLLKRKKKMTNFKLKKSNILALYGKRAKELESFAKENKLSFKDDADLKRMLNNFN